MRLESKRENCTVCPLHPRSVYLVPRLFLIVSAARGRSGTHSSLTFPSFFPIPFVFVWRPSACCDPSFMHLSHDIFDRHRSWSQIHISCTFCLPQEIFATSLFQLSQARLFEASFQSLVIIVLFYIFVLCSLGLFG